MSNAHDRALSHSSRTDYSVAQLQLLAQKYLQNPFSISWNKLIALFPSDRDLTPSEAFELEALEDRESNCLPASEFPPHFIDRIGPPIYYSVFVPPKQ